jgi:transposase
MMEQEMEKISMLKIKEVLRLKYEAKLSARKISKALNISHTVINQYIKRFESLSLSYEEIMKLSNKEMIHKLFGSLSKPGKYPIPDWNKIHQALRSKIVTLDLLHEEYRNDYPDGHYGYTWFCNRYKAYAKKLSPSMRQIHKAGEKVFIDFSGVRQAIADPITGEIQYAEIFVAVLGASGYPFVIAVPSQKKADFIYAHNEMFKAFDGVPELLVPDNLKSAVTRADRYEPDLNPDYVKLAEHYGTAIMPARGYKPQDKSLVENGVKLVQRWLLARLRHTTFYSIVQLNKAINELMPLYRNKKMKRLGISRQELFDTIDKPSLKPLPASDYEYKELKLLKVSIDYHIQLDHVLYSVPYQLIHKKVEVWFSTKMVSIYFEGKEVATHPRLYKRGAYSTQKAHMSSAHQKYLEWSPGRIMNWGLTVGRHTSKLLQTIMKRKPHPEMGYRSCLGLMRTFEKHKEKGMSEEQLDEIASYALRYQKFRLKQIKALLQTLPKEQEDDTAVALLRDHENVRGSSYYE